MNALISLHNRGFDWLEARIAPALLPTLARLVFAGTLLVYYWKSGLTKLGDGITGLFNPGFGAYGQILPRVFEASGYDLSQIGFLPRMVVLAGTWAEFILPALLLIGLASRLAALGMIGFVAAQSWVDINGHNLAAADIGTWFDGNPASLIVDQRAFWVFVLLVIILKGAGPISVDAMLSRYKRAA